VGLAQQPSKYSSSEENYVYYGVWPCCKVEKGEWNGLTGHLKDHGKDQLNSRTNSIKHEENDADQTEFRSLSVTALDHTRVCTRACTGLMLIFCILVINYNSISLF
jgi:hypothetical protein